MITHVSLETASSSPNGWIEPIRWIGSRSQFVRSTVWLELTTRDCASLGSIRRAGIQEYLECHAGTARRLRQVVVDILRRLEPLQECRPKAHSLPMRKIVRGGSSRPVQRDRSLAPEHLGAQARPLEHIEHAELKGRAADGRQLQRRGLRQPQRRQIETQCVRSGPRRPIRQDRGNAGVDEGFFEWP